MILLTGDNSFEITRMITSLKEGFDGDVESYDGESLEVRQLPDLLMGGTLFAPKRMVIIKDASHNKSLWGDFITWLDRLSEDIELVLVESSLDKRTKTAKHILTHATVHEFKIWTDRDRYAAEQWVVAEMTRLGGDLDKKCAQHLVSRLGVDQWLLHGALYKLSVLDSVTPEIIDEVIEPSPNESVFALFELALKGNSTGVSQAIKTLSLTEDPYRLMGLLVGQVFNLAALAVGTKPEAQIAKDIKAHPFALSKLSSPARRLGPVGARKAVAAFAEADAAMKSSATEPWLLIERALLKVAQLD